MAPVRVLVVDDSAVLRRLVTAVLEDDPDIAVVGTAASGRAALDTLSQVAPDCVVLDVEMPGLDGLATLRELRRTCPNLPVVMLSSLTERGAGATLDALALGADDHVCKPAHAGSDPRVLAGIGDQLVPKIKALCRPSSAASGVAARPLRRTSVPGADPPGRVDVLAIGCSTGGPVALAALLPQLPASFPVPVVVVQHMPSVFTRTFAQRLDGTCPLRVEEAQDGDLVRPGRVLIAPGGRHLELTRVGTSVVVRLPSGPPASSCRPAVDVLFRSVAQAYGARALAVVLTGAGSDGARGAVALHRAGAELVVQDAESSAVWEMPGAVASAGLAHRVLPLSSIGADVLRVVARERGRATLAEQLGAALA